MIEPYNLEAEMAVIGAMLTDPEKCYNLVIDMKIGEAHFHDSRARHAFAGVVELGEKCDLVIACNHFTQSGRPEVGDFLIEFVLGLVAIHHDLPSRHQRECIELLDNVFRSWLSVGWSPR